MPISGQDNKKKVEFEMKFDMQYYANICSFPIELLR